MTPTLPELPQLAIELSNIVETANAVYDDKDSTAT
jgi:hypothetical protein